jgi:hypothetical protein
LAKFAPVLIDGDEGLFMPTRPAARGDSAPVAVSAGYMCLGLARAKPFGILYDFLSIGSLFSANVQSVRRPAFEVVLRRIPSGQIFG